MKNKIVVMGLTLLLLMMLPLGVLAGEILISNGDFSQLDDSGLPVGWTYAAWNSEETVSTYWTETGEDGGTVVRLGNFSENDARLVGGFRRLDGYRRAVGNRRALRQDGLFPEQHGRGAARGLLRAGKPGLRVV